MNQFIYLFDKSRISIKENRLMRRVTGLGIDLSLFVIQVYLFDFEDGLPAARPSFLPAVKTDRSKWRSKSTLRGKRARAADLSSRFTSSSFLYSPLRPPSSNVPNKYNERSRTGSTGRDSALNGPFANFDVSTHVSFQTFYEVVDRVAVPYAGPNLTPFVSGYDGQSLRI